MNFKALAAARERIAEEYGEDPGRWLDQELLDSPAWSTVQARIAGIRDLDLLEHWRTVERALGRGRDGGGRSAVLDALDERREELERSEYGGVPIAEMPRIERPSTESNPTWVYEDPRSGEVERTTTRRSSFSREANVPWSWDGEDDAATPEVEASSGREQRRVVTDGGEAR